MHLTLRRLPLNGCRTSADLARARVRTHTEGRTFIELYLRLQVTGRRTVYSGSRITQQRSARVRGHPVVAVGLRRHQAHSTRRLSR
jgi:hypothetical protein